MCDVENVSFLARSIQNLEHAKNACENSMYPGTYYTFPVLFLLSVALSEKVKHLH
jgi:hypothetical protein